MTPDEVEFGRTVKQFLNEDLPIRVYNSVTDVVRVVSVSPRQDWGGAGLLGMTTRWTMLNGISENMFRVTSIEENSPSSKCGLQEEVDWIIGTPDTLFFNNDTLTSVLNASLDIPVNLIVYNSEQHSIRQVTVTPSKNWGGGGILGCSLGSGFLHKIPDTNHRPVLDLIPLSPLTFPTSFPTLSVSSKNYVSKRTTSPNNNDDYMKTSPIVDYLSQSDPLTHSHNHSHDQCNHSHNHSHDHSHNHSHDHSHNHSRDHSHNHSHDHSHNHSPIQNEHPTPLSQLDELKNKKIQVQQRLNELKSSYSLPSTNQEPSTQTSLTVTTTTDGDSLSQKM